MPPVTRRGYNNEFKHEVKSVSMPLQGHRPGVFISTPRQGRPPRRPPQCHPQQLSGLLSPPSGFSPSAAEPTHAGGTTSASSASMPLQEHRISSIQLCATAPLREPRHFMAHFPHGRDDLRVVRLNAVAGAPHFIYPAPRLCASQGTLWRIFHAGGTTSVSMPATFRSALSFLRFPPRPLQCPHPNQLRVCAPPCETFSLNSTDPQQPARRDFCHGATEPRSEVNVVPRHLRRTFVRVSQVPHPHLTSV